MNCQVPSSCTQNIYLLQMNVFMHVDAIYNYWRYFKEDIKLLHAACVHWVSKTLSDVRNDLFSLLRVENIDRISQSKCHPMGEQS